MTKASILRSLRQWPLGEVLVFIIKQAWAALFGGLLLLAIILTTYVHLPWLSRLDCLFVFAVLIQLGMLSFKLERPREVITIVSFHLTGLVMEVFKTSASVGSWSYSGHAVLHVGNVPLFSGFMYAAVGSYIARAWRVLELEFSGYPRRQYTALLALLIYANFFSNHYLPDIRLFLFAGLVLLYRKSWVSFRLVRTRRRMPLLMGFCLIAACIWLAENIGTYTNIWRYPSQYQHWHMVGLNKIGSWLLLMVISFIMVDGLRYLENRRNQHHK